MIMKGVWNQRDIKISTKLAVLTYLSCKTCQCVFKIKSHEVVVLDYITTMYVTMYL